MHHVVLDRWSRQSSFLHSRDPRAKIVTLVILLVAIATAGRALSFVGWGLLLMLVLGLRWARIPVGGALARASLVLPFTVVFAAACWLAGDPTRGLSLAVKSYVSALAVVFVVSTTPLPALLRGFESLGAPRFLLQVVQFLYRYLFVISEEAQHMAKAAVSRGASIRRWTWQGQRSQAAAGTLAVLFARSYARAECVHHAMLARGFNGTLPSLEKNRFARSDAIFALAASFLILAVRIASEGMVR